MILVIHRNKKDAAAISETFNYMGILSYGTTPNDALAEISLLYRAIIVLEPDAFPAPKDFILRLRAYANIPIFAITNSPVSSPEIYDDIFTLQGYSANLVSKIVSKTKKMELSCIGDYRLAGIDATSDKAVIEYFDTPLQFTKTESMILRFLIRSYPHPTNSEAIVKYAFRASRKPETASIRTHISTINKKFREITGRNMITLLENKGYLMMTPEVVHQNSKK